MNPASKSVVVDDLWEEFRRARERTRSLKEAASRFWVSRGRTHFWALRGVSLDIDKGQTVGLIGENGSGKTTLLRCIGGILTPSRGRVLVSGPVSSLIELGAGFHAELTGRENLETVGAIFGMGKSQLNRELDSLVSFAELENYIDQPIRTYSSGMSIRLSFSLAVHVDPEILLIDEVLAVGDESFQRKCMRRIEEMSGEGVTIVFVSHDLPLVKQVCKRCVLLHEGEVVADGDTAEVVDRYLAMEGFEASDGRAS